jgi:hypothetical protein
MHTAMAARTPSVYVGSRVNPITLYTGIALVGIWLGVALTSVFAPSLEIAGARQQQDLPIPAMSTWVWGAIATGLVLLAASRTHSDRATNLQLFGIGNAAVWIIAGLVSVFAPVLLVGGPADSVRVPVPALVAPVFSLVVTAFLSVYHAGSWSEEPQAGRA